MTDGCLNKSLSPLNLIILLDKCLALDGWIKGQVCVLWQGYSSPCSCQHFPRLLLSIRQWGKGHLIVLICMSEYQWGWMSPLPILLAICMSSFVNCLIQTFFFFIELSLFIDLKNNSIYYGYLLFLIYLPHFTFNLFRKKNRIVIKSYHVLAWQLGASFSSLSCSFLIYKMWLTIIPNAWGCWERIHIECTAWCPALSIR